MRNERLRELAKVVPYEVGVEGVYVSVTDGETDMLLTAEEATEMAQKLHIAASMIRLARAAQKRYDAERKGVENALNRRK